MPDSTRPLVSVVLPTLDRPERLERAVESVCAQTYPAVELVVVDDSDRPNRAVQSRSYPDLRRFEYVHRGEPEGLATARNAGIERARGDLIAFLDDDDRWLPVKLDRQVAAIERHGYGLCTCWRYMVAADGGREAVAGVDLDGDVTKKLLCRNVVGPPSGVVVSRETLDAAGTFDESFSLWEDREWYLRVSQVAPIGSVDAPLVAYAVDTPEKLSGNRKRVRDVAYPALLAKHADVLERYDPLARREIRGWRHHKLGLMAVQAGERTTGAMRAGRALAAYPFAWPFHRLLIRATLGPDRYARLETLLGRSNRLETPSPQHNQSHP